MELKRMRLVRSHQNNPRVNLAWEEYLAGTCRDDEVIFYLWQNANTVVIGRNQNAWAECRLDLMEQEGVTLARRSTGGGAVYHDLGNMNFTFILPRDRYDMGEQLSVILEALRQIGLECTFTGRNDLTLNGRKFSGNAYQIGKRIGLHHGTLLVNSNMKILPRYLNVDPEKLKNKGVKSVASRVINLCEEKPDLSIPVLADELEKAFLAHYACPERAREDDIPMDDPEFRKILGRYESREWLLGRSPECEIHFKKRFTWGGLELFFDIRKACICDLKIFSDVMDADFIEPLTSVLDGKEYDRHVLADAVRNAFPGRVEAEDFAEWFESGPEPLSN